MRTEMEEILALQDDWSSLNTAEMSLRGSIIRAHLPVLLRQHVTKVSASFPDELNDIDVQGRDGTGLKSEIPWVRIFSRSRSERATEGWYLVYLFDAFGDRVYLSINQGTTRWDGGEFRARSKNELATRSKWAQGVLNSDPKLRPDLVDSINLPTRASALGAGYESGNVFALDYASPHLPKESSMISDLEYMVALLAKLYAHEDSAPFIPGDVAPEILDALDSAEAAAGNRPKRAKSRLTGPERKAIEMRAVDVAIDHLQSLGYKTKDVGLTESYDIDARKGNERLYVEVKGTMSLGGEIVLTRKEVALHVDKFPDNMLVVVSGIRLIKKPEPIAKDGILRAISPWAIDEQRLVPISYTYSGQEISCTEHESLADVGSLVNHDTIT